MSAKTKKPVAAIPATIGNIPLPSLVCLRAEDLTRQGLSNGSAGAIMAHRSRRVVKLLAGGSFNKQDLTAMEKAGVIPAGHGYPTGKTGTGTAAAIAKVTAKGWTLAPVAAGKNGGVSFTVPTL
jgi:hypothetical protein